ncbi:LOW QUALITY PROTEIN: hypothetical protein PHMEG_00019785 [Phytophthora megakarya]|uniref:Eukaryotic/viral aspartic protease n=1 Tax=Phytophthora megakarya TaxID=4795 RepID=A0A225VR13_9STRA|nr:LOW QUALITY PROTEIN: hypothetical protein PHMEG_00019785 [Phytophthora megakarya]
MNLHQRIMPQPPRVQTDLSKFFNAAMDRYLAEEREANKDPASTRPQHQGSQDVEMESIRSSDHGSRWEYDPDDVDFPTSAQATVATATAGSTGSTMIQRVRISAISDLKEFAGKDQDEDRARAWMCKVKSAFMGNQASDDEKCLTFADLLAGSAKNWYRQLSRSTRNKWSDLLRSFQIQYCGLGVSVARQYYHTRRRSDESPLDYLYRLNVAGLCARLKIKDGNAKERREHRLTLLRLTDADDLEEVLRARHRAKNRQKKAAIFLAANEDVTPKVDKESLNLDPRLRDRDHGHQDHNSKIHGNGFNRDRRSHCGSRKHSDLGCWRRVTWTKCGKRGYPSDHCLFVCRGWGELHDMGKYSTEEFYNQIRQWFNPTKHMDAKLGRSSGWNPIRAERSSYCIYAFVNKTSVDQVSKRPDLHGNTRDLHGKRTFAISSLRQVDEYARSEVTMSVDLQPGESRGYWRQQDLDYDHEVTPKIQKPSKIAEYRQSTTMDLLPGESRGYWKHHSPGKWFRQAKITGKIHNEKAILLLDTGAEVSIVDTAFARKVGCYIDWSKIQDCVGIGDNVYQTEGRTRIKVTLAASLVYFFRYLGG